MNTTEWYRANPEKAKEHSRKYLSNPENKERNRKYKARWFQENKEKMAYEIKQKSKNPKEHIKIALRNRKAKSKIAFDITVDDIVIPEVCPIFGTPLTFGKKISLRESAATVDRIDSKKGYVKGNVQIICYRANRIKNDASLEELIKMGEWAKNVLNSG